MSTTVALPDREDRATPWLKQKGETAAAYAAFVVYRDQVPPRSVAKLAKALGRGKRVLDGWSIKFKWVERADAWTAHLDALAVAAHEEDVVRRRREENQRLYEIGRDLQTAGHFRLTGATDPKSGKEMVKGIHPDELDADDVARWLDLGTKFVRLSMGLPTDFTGVVQISLNDLQRILGSFIAIAEKHMEPDAHEALVRECYAMVRETLGE